MVKCSMVGCTGKVVGIFEEIVDAATIADPTATLRGAKTAWCREHAQTAREGLCRGRFLTQAEIRIEELRP